MICYKERNLSFSSLYGVWGDDFNKKISNFRRKKIPFYFITFNFLGYYSSLNLKSQSEHSGLGPDTSSLVGVFKLSVYFPANKAN